MELMPVHLQALDLPEIMDIIGHYLPKGSLLACIQVNRSWHDYFVPILWRSFIFSAYSFHPRPPIEAFVKYSHYIHQLEFSGPVPPMYMSIGCKNLDFLKVVGERRIYDDETLPDPLSTLVQDNQGLQRLIVYDVSPHPDEAFWDSVAQLTELRNLMVSKTEIPSAYTPAFFKAISAYTPSLRLDRVYFTPVRVEEEEEGQDQDQVEDEAETEGQHGSSETTQPEETTDNNNDEKDESPGSEEPTTFTYKLEDRPDVTFSHLKQLYLFDLNGTGYDKQAWILEHSPRLERLSWRGGSDFEFPTASLILALESGNLPHLESLELKGSHLTDQELAQILTSMDRLFKLSVPHTELGPAAMKVLFQHYETVRELDISGCENVRSWMIQLFLSKFVSLEVFVADMLSIQDITTDPWVCTKLRKLSLDFEMGYVAKEDQEIIEDEKSSDEEEEEESEAEGDDEDNNWTNVEPSEEGDETVANEVAGEDEEEVMEEEMVIKEEETSEVEEETVAELDAEQAAVETVIAAEDETVEDGKAESTIPTIFEGMTPEQIAAAIAAAQWEEEEAVAAEEKADGLWKEMVPYVHSEERQRIVFERLGQLKMLEELNIMQQAERPYSAAEQLRAGVVLKVLDLSLDNGMDLLAGLTRLRHFYFPGPQAMEEQEVRWIIEHWGRLTHMSGQLNPRRKVNRKLLSLLDEHSISAASTL
ncbi:hypothetical protein BGX29_000475 [Mortierella sp. GBA35]|nr:hypothetical protein BGX29_000475 [Mortierella sp. GBA35]